MDYDTTYQFVGVKYDPCESSIIDVYREVFDRHQNRPWESMEEIGGVHL